MESASETEKNNWKSIGKAVKKHPLDCMEMHKMLLSYQRLGDIEVVIENGVRVTKCPKAWCRGVQPNRNVQSRS